MLSQSQHREWERALLEKSSLGVRSASIDTKNSRPSKVNSRYTVHERSTVLCHLFSSNLDQIVVGLRRGALSEHNWQALKKIVSDPDFEFHRPLQGWKRSPMALIIELGNVDGILSDVPENPRNLLTCNEEQQLIRIAENIQDELRVLSRQGVLSCGQKVEISNNFQTINAPNDLAAFSVDKALRCLAEFAQQIASSVNTASSFSSTAGQMALELLQIARDKGLDLNVPTVTGQFEKNWLRESPIYYCRNVQIADLLFEGGAQHAYDKIAAPGVNLVGLEKTTFRLTKLFEVAPEDGNGNTGYIFRSEAARNNYRSMHDHIESFFSSTSLQSLMYLSQYGDIVSTLLSNAGSLEEGFCCRMLNHARSVGYPFANILVPWDRLCPVSLGSDLLYHFVDSSSFYGEGAIAPDVFEYLLKQGISPDHENNKILLQSFDLRSSDDSRSGTEIALEELKRRGCVRNLVMHDLEMIEELLSDDPSQMEISYYGYLREQRKQLVRIMEGKNWRGT